LKQLLSKLRDFWVLLTLWHKIRIMFEFKGRFVVALYITVSLAIELCNLNQQIESQVQHAKPPSLPLPDVYMSGSRRCYLYTSVWPVKISLYGQLGF
jgi:hypothetical protein